MSLSKKKMFVFLVRSLSSMFLEINVSKLTKLLNFKMYNSHNLVDLNRFKCFSSFNSLPNIQDSRILSFQSNSRSTKNEHKSFKYFLRYTFYHDLVVYWCKKKAFRLSYRRNYFIPSLQINRLHSTQIQMKNVSPEER